MNTINLKSKKIIKTKKLKKKRKTLYPLADYMKSFNLNWFVISDVKVIKSRFLI